MHSIEQFPDEVLILIMSYLGFPDRLNARLVNKRWCELSYSAGLTKNDITSVTSFKQLRHLNLNRKYLNIKIKEAQKKGEPCNVFPDFWKKCGEYVRSIEFYKTVHPFEFLPTVFQFTPNIEYIYMSGIKENSFWRSGPSISTPTLVNIETEPLPFPKLLSIDIHGLENQTFPFLKAVTVSSPKLKRIGIECLNQDVSSSMLDIYNHSMCQTLKELNISSTGITDELILKIFNFVGSELTGLYLRKNKNLTDVTLNVIPMKFPKLKELDLSINAFTAEGIKDVLSNIPNMTHVSLEKTKADDLTAISKFEKTLKALDLSCCSAMTGATMQNTFTHTTYAKLIDLRLDYLKISEEVILSIVPHVPYLKYLYLNGCRNLTDKGLKAISNCCKLLRSISMQGCVKLTDVSVLNCAKGLIHIDLFGCYKVTCESIKQFNFLELQSVDLSDTLISNIGLEEVLKKCPSIQMVFTSEEYLYKELKESYPKVKFHCGFSRFVGESIFDS